MPINIDSLNKKLESLAKGIDITTVSGQLSQISTKFKAFDLTEMGKVAGDIKGGFEGLTQNIDNAVEALAGQLDANGFPSGGVNSATINKLDKSVQAAVPALKTALASHSADISALVSSAHAGSAAMISAAAPLAKELTSVAEGLMDDIVTDGSPEAIAGVLKAKANVTPQEIKSLLGEVANADVAGIIDGACKDLLDFKLPTDMGATLSLASDQLSKALGGLDGGNLLKAAVENFSGDIKNTLTSVATSLEGVKSLGKLTSLANTAISGDLKAVAEELIKEIQIPAKLDAELKALGTNFTGFTSAGQMQTFLNGAKNLNLSTTALTDVSTLTNKLNIVNEKVLGLDTSLTKSITQPAPSNTPVVNPASYSGKSIDLQNSTSAALPPAGRTDGKFPFLNSEEEIVRYLQGATRDITTVVWHWTANYSDQGYIGSEQINQMHINRGWNGIGYHFIVKRDGSIQIGRDINTVGAHVGGFNTRSIGISFVAGYKCASTKYKGIPPFSEVGPESITQAQHEAFKRFMSAWYRVYPGGQVWGHVDFPNNKGKIDPGFDVAKRCYELFGKRNVGHPKKDGAILTAEQIASKRQFA